MKEVAQVTSVLSMRQHGQKSNRIRPQGCDCKLLWNADTPLPINITVYVNQYGVILISQASFSIPQNHFNPLLSKQSVTNVFPMSLGSETTEEVHQGFLRFHKRSHESLHL
jgi:hypothetical protein